MITVHQKIADAGDQVAEAEDELWLDYDQRKRGRLKAVTAAGHDIGLFLQRGDVLRDGDLLIGDCGRVIKVRAANEDIAIATCENWERFSRACYHLGNRHVSLEIGERSLRFPRDAVLEELAHLLGLEVSHRQAPFNPEAGAYSGHGHQHSH